MAYIVAADLRERTRASFAADIALTENDGTDAYIDLIIAQMSAQVELDLGDDFEPPSPDNDETLLVDGYGRERLNIQRRVRSLTTVETLNAANQFISQAPTTWSLRKSLNAAGTAMKIGPDGKGLRRDFLDALPGLTTTCWPYGAETVRLTGKFGWAAVPSDIKRLVALKVYDAVKARSDPLTSITQRTTVDSVVIYGESREMLDISARYRRGAAYVG